MGRRLFFWELAGFLWTGLLGTLLRSAYGWSGKSALAAAFTQVNGSVWEEMKLLFLPVFLFSVLQICFLGRNYPNLPAVRAVSLLTGLTLLPALFYTYSGALGYRLLWADRAAFFLAATGLFLLDFRLLRQGRRTELWRQILGLLALWGLVFLFVWCTFRPPHLALWQDPSTGGFGLG